jgi:hypothetical protein
MPQAHIMILEEEAVIALKEKKKKKQGKQEEYERMRKQIPLQPYLAKFAKEHFGADFLIKSGWNLAEAEAEYGPDWLHQ